MKIFDLYISKTFISFIDKFNLIDLSISNPFKSWWKARKYFRMPIPKIKFFFRKQDVVHPYVYNARLSKIIDINISDVGWKDKYDSPRYEFDPRIFICLFRRIGFYAYPYIYRTNEYGEKKDGRMYYWEYLLDYLHYNKSLKPSSFWEHTNDKIIERKNLKFYTLTHIFSLNKKGLKKFKELCM